MSASAVGNQIREVIGRLIEAGLSVRQFYPSEKETTGGGRLVGVLPPSAGLKNIAYSAIYSEMEEYGCYHVKLPDGALLSFQYTFDGADILTKHRLAFFPPHSLPTIEEAPLLYENDELYGDIILDRIVRFPMRFDYDPGNAKQATHPASHFTIGQFENCRIPVSHPIEPHTFALFVLRNFYHRSYMRNKNLFDKGLKRIHFDACLTESEKRIAHVVMV